MLDNLSPMKRGEVALSHCQDFLLVEMCLVDKVPCYPIWYVVKCGWKEAQKLSFYNHALDIIDWLI